MSDHKKQRPLRHCLWFVVGSAVVVLVAAFAALWSKEVQPTLDDLGLFNATHTFLHTGAMAYPIYPVAGAREAMFIHPPTHYFLLAAISWLTHLPVEAAALVLPLFWVFVGVILVVTSRFSNAWKFATMAGLYLGIVVWAQPFYIRPDVDMAGAWIIGLLALEAGRLREWNPVLMAFGGFALALASALHYPMTASVFGIGIYFAWAFRDLERKQAWRVTRALAVGAGIVSLPYVVFFVAPDFHNIVAFNRSTTGSFDPIGALLANFDGYKLLAAQHGGGVISWLMRPIAMTRVPLVILTTPFLFWRRETRGIALASLPSLLFLLITNTRPDVVPIYGIGGVTLYLMTVLYAMLLLCETLIARAWKWAQPDRVVAMLGMGLVVFLVYSDTPEVGYLTANAFVAGRPEGLSLSSPLHNEMGLARAAGYSIVGPGALMASQDSANLWYVSGATSWYSVLYPDDPFYDVQSSLLNVRGYAAGITAFPVSHVGTTAALWYERGYLHMEGFYFGVPIADAVGIKYDLFSATAGLVKGYVSDNDSLTEYQQTAAGPERFVVAVCPNRLLASLEKLPGVRWGLTTTVGGTTEVPGGGTWVPTAGGNVLLSAIVDRLELDSIRRTASLDRCHIQTSLPMQGHRVSARALMAREVRAGDNRTMSFPAVPLALNALYAPSVPTVRTAQLALHKADIAAGTQVKRTVHGWRVVTPPLPFSEALSVPISVMVGQSSMWVKVTASVEHGSIGLCVVDVPKNVCLVRRLIDASLPGPYYIFVPMTADPEAVYLDNQSTPATTLDITKIEVLQGH